MNIIFHLLPFFFTAVCSITITSTSTTSFNSAMVNFLDNYLGCRRWSQGECIQCSQGFYFNESGVCCEVDKNCQHFNRALGICQECYLGYELMESKCLIKTNLSRKQKGCRIFEQNKCIECSQRWFLNSQEICEPVNDLCRKWNKTNGSCTACYLGHSLKQGSCYTTISGYFFNPGPFCAQINENKCLRCEQRAFFSPIGICIPVENNCKTWDLYEGYCLLCLEGFELEGGQCNAEKTSLRNKCMKWDENNQKCMKCIDKWRISQNGGCEPIMKGCLYLNEDNECISCQKGFELKDQFCHAQTPTKNLTPLGCQVWDMQASKCLKCSSNWIFNQYNQCIPFFDSCIQYQPNTGNCQACYHGFSLLNSKCIISEQNAFEENDPGCKFWNYEKLICEQCSFRWFLNSVGKCEKVSDLCQQFHAGKCTACYSGYELREGECIKQKNSNCAVKSKLGCIECSIGYFINEGKCVPTNPICKSSNKQGDCTSCFSMFVLYNKVCIPLQKLANLAKIYASCCPQKLRELKMMGRIA